MTKRCAVALMLLIATPALAGADAVMPLQPSPTWEALRPDVIGTDRDPAPADCILTLEAPARAANPAVVPVHLTQPAGAPAIARLVLVADENPSPVVATFTFGPALHPLDLELRIRVDAYSDLRAIATLADGRQVMAGQFVKASGGCAAPAGYDAEAAARIGEMRLKSAPAPDGRMLSTLMIRHPQFSGFQRDQVTLLNIPARFLDQIEVRQGDALLFTLEGGISLSEDPVIRFAHPPGTAPVTVTASDTDGQHFTLQPAKVAP